MKEPWFLGGIRICDGWGKAPTTTYTILFSGKGLFHQPDRGTSSAMMLPGTNRP
jgi:hypothetical protein